MASADAARKICILFSGRKVVPYRDIECDCMQETESRRSSMTDVHTREQRSRNMAAIKGKNTKPEMRVRSVLHSLGYRFRLHRKDLPGRPDIVLPKYRVAIFVHGCFWHCHDCRYGRVVPATRSEFWAAKRGGTVQRDAKNLDALRAASWQTLTVWECETQDPIALAQRLQRLLGTSDNG
jgi:DNA mismatch endonuclease (patch repair protein)